MAKLILHTEDVEEDFFADCRLLAIGSAMPGYTLCWWLNQVCNFNFIRQPDMDICVKEGRVLPSKGGGLFADLEAPPGNLFYFPVYKHDLPYYEASVLLYTNSSSSRKLIPELRFADFLMLVPFASYICAEEKVYDELTRVPDIAWVRDIDLEPLKNKRNLIL